MTVRIRSFNSGQAAAKDRKRRPSYNATVTLSTGATETLIPAGEGIAFPLGTLDTFVTHGVPANLIETVNTVGLPIYARQIARPDGSAIEIKTERRSCRSTSARGWRCGS